MSDQSNFCLAKQLDRKRLDHKVDIPLCITADGDFISHEFTHVGVDCRNMSAIFYFDNQSFAVNHRVG
jgi:hypothetical protein